MPSPPISKAGVELHERALLYGGSDSGKSRALLCIAKWHQKRGSDAVFYICSNDLGYEPLLAPGGEFDDLENVDVKDATTMAEHFEIVRRANAKIRSHDWLVVDLLSAVWDAAQDEYAERQFGKDLAEYWSTEAPKGSDDYPVKGWEWGPINKRYRSFAINEVMRTKGHVMCMSGQSPLKQASRNGTGGETPEIAALYGRIGWKPAGQKDDTHRFHTVLHLAPKPRRDGWTWTTARDRAAVREAHTAEPLSDFFMGYLRGVGGWSL